MGMNSAMTHGYLPSIGTNQAGNPSGIRTCYGYYNNANSTTSQYAPALTAGLFFRFNNQAGSATLYIPTVAGLQRYGLELMEMTPPA